MITSQPTSGFNNQSDDNFDDQLLTLTIALITLDYQFRRPISNFDNQCNENSDDQICVANSDDELLAPKSYSTMTLTTNSDNQF